MWTQSVSMVQLSARDSWKVEFFCGEVIMGTTGEFDSVSLGKVLRERRETVDPQAEPSRLFNYLGLENIQSVTGDLVDFDPKPGKSIRSRSKVFRRGDILYGRLRPYLNKVYLASDEQVSTGICSGEFYVLVPDLSRVLPNFLRAILTSSYVQQHAIRWQTGSALPRLQLADLLGIEIPLPPLVLQTAYEEYIAAENRRRRLLAAEAAALPQRILDTVIRALELGEDPISLDVVGN